MTAVPGPMHRQPRGRSDGQLVDADEFDSRRGACPRRRPDRWPVTPTPGFSATKTAPGSCSRSTAIGSSRSNTTCSTTSPGGGVDEHRTVGTDREPGRDVEFPQERQRCRATACLVHNTTWAPEIERRPVRPLARPTLIVSCRSRIGAWRDVQGAVDVQGHHLRATRRKRHHVIPRVTRPMMMRQPPLPHVKPARCWSRWSRIAFSAALGRPAQIASMTARRSGSEAVIRPGREDNLKRRRIYCPRRRSRMS